MQDLKIKNVRPGTLKPHPKNPRIHPDSAITKLEKSITGFGWTNPVLITKDNTILAGHARVKAAKQAKLQFIPVITLPLSGAKADAYLIADNKLQDETFWDEPGLRAMIERIKTDTQRLKTDFDLTMTAFSQDELDIMHNLYLLDLEMQESIEEGTDEEEDLFVTCPNCGHKNALYKKEAGNEQAESRTGKNSRPETTPGEPTNTPH